MAGHSKWANIKHRKGRQDAKRSKIWSKCSKAIMVAAKNGGGNPEMNLALRYAIDEAKAQNMPKDTIANAIKKGTGEMDGVVFETIVYEGYGPAGVAVMVDILTDNRNRTAAELRKIFERSGGNLGATGCVAYNFEQKGQIFVAKQGADEEELMMAALEAGADDVSGADESFEVLTEPAAYTDVRSALDTDYTIESGSVAMIPQQTVEVTGKDVNKVMNFIDALEDNDDVQKVHANFDISDEDLAALED
ncbi:putative transcriptional regulatory protein [Poriferisphaera corsica]|uniref:Probable transcriptional regulatory protein KS4_00720 n=1 Tax=Poriferisphaera corsica TaxID=2528020 RepID=A0A517YP90_9BACT|nr:YebC/PmpR family DNA-binding transcriptional regulator [Poriferisphaera corsica]QDU32044.1 putative transcriptional regulatory protein [Poriferisphaera corsica]